MANKTEAWSPAPVSGVTTPTPAAGPTAAPAPTPSQEMGGDTQPTPAATQGFTSEESKHPRAPGPTPALGAPLHAPVGPQSLSNADTSSSALRTSPGELVGTHLKHFRIDNRLAAGGMGEVFLGYDTSLSRPVAIKTIRGELARDGAFLARFVREATAQANVVHPHVVQVYYVGEDRGLWFLAMQIVDGGSLHDSLAKTPITKMRWQDAAKHMTAICEGLVVAERLGIVHRDIKPSNILVDREGRALLSDFGLAASAGTVEGAPDMSKSSASGASTGPSGSQLQLASVTQVGVVMGTPEYVAPEQLRVGPLDSRADMYALAATFFHLVSGVPVMPVQGLGEAISKYAAGHRAPPLQSVARGVPRAFARVIDTCLERDPNARYPTMLALLAALRRAGAQPEVPAGPSLRSLVWLLDIAPFIALAAATSLKMPWLAPLLFIIAGAVGVAALGSTPGIWLMRLRLRTVGDGDVSFGRGFVRFLIQHGWYVPLTLGFYALYAASDLDAVLLGVGFVWLAASVIGSLGALIARKQTLHDFLTKTRVLVDTRYR